MLWKEKKKPSAIWQMFHQSGFYSKCRTAIVLHSHTHSSKFSQRGKQCSVIPLRSQLHHSHFGKHTHAEAKHGLHLLSQQWRCNGPHTIKRPPPPDPHAAAVNTDTTTKASKQSDPDGVCWKLPIFRKWVAHCRRGWYDHIWNLLQLYYSHSTI